MVDTIFELVGNLHERGVTILLVEQNAERAPAIVDRVYVLKTGLIEIRGNPEQLEPCSTSTASTWRRQPESIEVTV